MQNVKKIYTSFYENIPEEMLWIWSKKLNIYWSYCIATKYSIRGYKDNKIIFTHILHISGAYPYWQRDRYDDCTFNLCTEYKEQMTKITKEAFLFANIIQEGNIFQNMKTQYSILLSFYSDLCILLQGVTWENRGLRN